MLTKTKLGIYEYTVEEDAIEFFLQQGERSFIYRGLSNSDYELIPTAYRPDSSETVSLSQIARKYMEPENINTNGYKMETREIFILKEFYLMANAQGIDVPRIKSEHPLDFRSVMCKERIDDWLDVAALAQHYGLPTRLLDWTTDPFIALYFAVKNDDNSHDSAIWILDRQNCFEIYQVRLITPRYCGNPNIMAQSGLMTAYIGDNHPQTEPLDRIISEEIENSSLLKNNKDAMVMMKIIIPAEKKRELKARLANMGYNHCRVFPGLYSIVQEMKDIQT